LAIGLFAISPIALVQCTQAKQYSTEMLVALCLYLLYHYIYSKKLNASRGILFGIAGGVIVWFSFSAVFFMAPLLLVLIIFPNNKNDRSDYFWLCFISTIWMLSALVHFSLVHALLSNANRALSEGLPGLFRAHPELLIGFPPTKTGLSLGLVTPLRDLLDVKYKYVSFCVLILGFTSIWRRRKDLFIVLIIPPIEVFLLSMLKIYPTGYTRYVIFLLPAFLFATAEGVEYAVKLIHVKYIPVKLLIVAFILFTPLQRAIGVIRSNPYQHDMKSVLSYVNDHRLRSDKIYVYYKSVPAFLFYAPQYGIKQEDYIKGIGHPPHLEEDRKDILRVNDYERSWVVFSDVPFEKEKYFLSQLDGIKKETDSFHAVGASAYLYD
jgi:hypothetical protein